MEMKLTSIRISQAALSASDSLVPYVCELHAGSAKRSDVLRLAISRGLELLENEQKNAGGSNATA